MAVIGVEHVGRQAAVHLEAIGAADVLVEAKCGDAEDFAQSRFALLACVVAQPSFELAQDRILGVAAHANDEGDAELLPIGCVEPVEAIEFLVVEPIEAGAGLLGLGLKRQRIQPHRLVSEVRVAGDECVLPLAARLLYRLLHGLGQGGKRRERPLAGGGLRDPGRVFVDVA